MDEHEVSNRQNKRTLSVDVEYYQSFLDDTDISDEEKREFIQTLWAIMIQFVDLGFGLEATQLAKKFEHESSDGSSILAATFAEDNINTRKEETAS